jgi:hypothetical protein
MAKPAGRSIRDMRISARNGDRAAIRTLLRLEGFARLAAEVHRNKPIKPRVERMVAALTAGIGSHDAPHPVWEYVNRDGEIECLLHHPPSVRRSVSPLVDFED